MVKLAMAMLCCFVAPTVGDFILLDPAKYESNFIEGAPSSAAGIVNKSTFEWAKQNLPFFDTSDQDLVKSFYFRIKTYKSHVQQTDYPATPFVVSEYGPAVHWGGAYGKCQVIYGCRSVNVHIIVGRIYQCCRWTPYSVSRVTETFTSIKSC